MNKENKDIIWEGYYKYKKVNKQFTIAKRKIKSLEQLCDDMLKLLIDMGGKITYYTEEYCKILESLEKEK